MNILKRIILFLLGHLCLDFSLFHLDFLEVVGVEVRGQRHALVFVLVREVHVLLLHFLQQGVRSLHVALCDGAETLRDRGTPSAHASPGAAHHEAGWGFLASAFLMVMRENMAQSLVSAMETPGRSIFSSTLSLCFRRSFRSFFFFLFTKHMVI